MTKLRWTLLAAALCSPAAGADPTPVPLIDRPLTLPAGEVAPVIGLDFTDWSSGGSLSGESVKAGFDVGVTDHFQLGLVANFPVNPGAGFGSVFLNLTGMRTDNSAIRLDLGYERIGLNGVNGTAVEDGHTDLGVIGFGVPFKQVLSRYAAFISGSSSGAASFNRFVNVGSGGQGLYYGAGALSEGGNDNLIVSHGDNGGGTLIGVNVPFGLMAQPNPYFSFTFRFGFSAVIAIPSGGSANATFFLPLGLDLVVSPAKALDLGASFTLDGPFASSGGLDGSGYFDLRTVQVWLRFHI